MATISGRYEGERTTPQPGNFLLDLRIDVDPLAQVSPAMHRVSGDLYQISRVTLPGRQPQITRTYVESWIVDSPTVTTDGQVAEITGALRFWMGVHPSTTVVIKVNTNPPPGTIPVANATFTESGGA